MDDKEIKTRCFNCESDTNQTILFKDSVLGPQEIIGRNEEGDESQSLWQVAASIWTVSKCLGCEELNFKHILRTSPDRESDKIFHFPFEHTRPAPSWVFKLPIKYLELLHEVYGCVNQNLFILALTGIRTVLDVFIADKVGDIGTFKQKLQRLVTDGIITSAKAKVLEATIDAGNAAAHRGFKPDEDTLFQILDIVEHLLQSEIVDRPVNQIIQKTPKRS
jgi:hypothetical protein